MSDQVISKIFLIQLVIWTSPLTRSCKFNCKIIFPHCQINKNIESSSLAILERKKMHACKNNGEFYVCVGEQRTQFSLSPNSSKNPLLKQYSSLIYSIHDYLEYYKPLHARIHKVLLITSVTMCNLTENNRMISKVS